MAIKKACLVKNSVKNTGKECDIAMGPTAMLIAIAPGQKFDEDDMEDEYAWMNDLIHQKVAYPLFGQKAPIRTITNNAENDVTVTMDDGLQVFLRYGLYNRTFETTSGGLCYAASLQSFLNSGYSIIEIDQSGQMLVRKNEDKTYSGITADFMYSPSPVLADLKSTPYKNRFQYSFSPVELVNNGSILKGAASILSLGGLIDVELVDGGGSATTFLEIEVTTDCAETDLVSLFTTKWNSTTLFVVKNKLTGAVVTLSGVTNSGGNKLHLAGTFVSGQTYVVTGTTAVALKAVLIEGYEIVDGVEITI